eukprot:752073-Hanusia_phi.AAC.7
MEISYRHTEPQKHSLIPALMFDKRSGRRFWPELALTSTSWGKSKRGGLFLDRMVRVINRKVVNCRRVHEGGKNHILHLTLLPGSEILEVPGEGEGEDLVELVLCSSTELGGEDDRVALGSLYHLDRHSSEVRGAVPAIHHNLEVGNPGHEVARWQELEDLRSIRPS